MEQIPTWLAAAVAAAGMTTVYACDWDRVVNDAVPRAATPSIPAFQPDFPNHPH